MSKFQPKFFITDRHQDCVPLCTYVAIRGQKWNGHDFISSALKSGAARIVCEYWPKELETPPNIDVEVCGQQIRKRMAELAAESYGFPAKKLKMIGITGTSGKTSTCSLIHHMLNSVGIKTARLGTLGASFLGRDWETHNTTPGSIWIQKFLREIVDLGAEACAMEVSSHSLAQDRVWGIDWHSTLFLNLSSEHLDYHSTMEDYFQAKAKLFTEYTSQNCIINIDDTYGRKLSLFSLRTKEIRLVEASQSLKNVEFRSTGIKAEAELPSLEGSIPFNCSIFGNFQTQNIAMALQCVDTIVKQPEAIKRAITSLEAFPGIPGRMQLVSYPNSPFQVFVDYAHKPEALKQVLESLPNVKIITVFGCGGDRDKTKRPVMGAIAAQYSEWVIITSDNPRTEDPLSIISEIKQGIGQKTNFETVPDRRDAIARAIQLAKPGYIVLIAGKGHEEEQIIGHTTLPFSDVHVARELLSMPNN